MLLDGVNVRDLDLSDIRSAVGIVFEDTFLFSDSVRENIAFANPEAHLDQVRRAAALSGAADFIESLPDGYETVIGEHGYSLSGGQRTMPPKNNGQLRCSARCCSSRACLARPCLFSKKQRRRRIINILASTVYQPIPKLALSGATRMGVVAYSEEPRR